MTPSPPRDWRTASPAGSAGPRRSGSRSPPAPTTLISATGSARGRRACSRWSHQGDDGRPAGRADRVRLAPASAESSRSSTTPTWTRRNQARAEQLQPPPHPLLDLRTEVSGGLRLRRRPGGRPRGARRTRWCWRPRRPRGSRRPRSAPDRCGSGPPARVLPALAISAIRRSMSPRQGLDRHPAGAERVGLPDPQWAARSWVSQPSHSVGASDPSGSNRSHRSARSGPGKAHGGIVLRWTGEGQCPCDRRASAEQPGSARSRRCSSGTPPAW